jgi:DnaJ-class molecular chaperone
MEQSLEKPGIVVIVKDCRECRGMGIKIGPFDEDLGDRIVRECQHCNGFGIRIARRRDSAAVAGLGKAR